MQYSQERRTHPGDLSFIFGPSDRDLQGTPGKPRTISRTDPRFEQFSKASFLMHACSALTLHFGTPPVTVELVSGQCF